jgi:hypothetical protein
MGISPLPHRRRGRETAARGALYNAADQFAQMQRRTS